MISYLEKALNVRRHELLPASLLFLYLFLVIGAYIIGQSAGDALFLSVFPRYLPHAIMATSVAVGILVSVYIRLSRHIRMATLAPGLLGFFAASFTLLWWCLRLHAGSWVYPAIFIMVYAAGAMAPIIGWTLANYVLTTREARRVFGFVGAGAILGATASGLLTAAVTKELGADNLILLTAVILAAGAAVVRLLFSVCVRRIDEAELLAQSGTAPASFRESWRQICSSRYLLLITALIAIGSASTTIIGYQFKMIAQAHFGGNKEVLAAFFGRFYGLMGLASFFLQLIVTGRLLRSVGIRVTLFILPLIFLGGSLGVLLAPTLLMAVVLKGSHNLLRYSLDKSSAELLYLPVPTDIKNQVKSFIDGFIWRTADGVAGLVLLQFATFLHFGPGRISLVNFVFLGLWIGVAYGVRREYLNVLRQAIQRTSAVAERPQTDDKTTTDMIAIAFDQGDEQQVLYGLTLYEQAREPRWHPMLRGLLQHPSAAVRQRVLRALSEASDREILPHVQAMLRDRSPLVRTEALQYLVLHTECDPVSLISSGTQFPDWALQAAVVAYLARLSKPGSLITAQTILDSMLTRDDAEGGRARCEAARALAAVPPPTPLHHELARLLRDPDPAVVTEALLTAGKLQLREYLPLVVGALGEPELVVPARDALRQFGERAIGTLQDHLNDERVPLAVRKRIPDTLAEISTPQAAGLLVLSLSQPDPGLRFDVLKALNKLCRREPRLVSPSQDFEDILHAEIIGFYRSFQILAAIDPDAANWLGPAQTEGVLVRALRERMEHDFERIFRMLALLYPPHDIQNAFYGLVAGHAQVQANAVEVLEHVLKPDLYRRLVYALDAEINLEAKINFAQELCGAPVASRAEALRLLIHGDDRWLRACALHMVAEWQETELYEDVLRTPHEGDDLLHETWQRVMARLDAEANAQGARMLSVLEKVERLQRMPIFHDVRTESLARVASGAQETVFRPDDVIYREQEPADAMYLILEGEVKMLRNGQPTRALGAGEAAGVLGLLAGERQPETAIALRTTRTLRLDQQDFYDAMADDFQITRGILRGLIGVINTHETPEEPVKAA